MASIVALYPGQGSQYPKMALDLYDASKQVQDLFALASEVSGINLYTLLNEGTEDDLKQTTATQLVVTLASRSAHLRLKELGHRFVGHSGFSLGELAAYAAGGILDDTTLFTIIKGRASLMDREAKKAQEVHGNLGMAAVIGLGYDKVASILAEGGIKGLYPANDNGPSQVVVSGLVGSIEEAKPLLIAQGARRVIPLKVSGPFHTPFMQEAESEFRTFLNGLTFSDPKETVISSVDGKAIVDAQDARNHLALQLANPVRWTLVMQNINLLKEEKQALVAEVGAGTVLAGLWKNSGLGGSCLGLGLDTAIQTLQGEV